MDFGSLVGTRIRIQRLRDAQIFSGWVDTAAGSLMHISVSQGEELNPGDEIFCEAHTFSQRISFRGHCEKRMGDGSNIRYVVRLRTQAQSSPGTENPRFRVPPTPCRIQVGDSEMRGTILDVSVAGFGGSTPQNISRGEIVEIVMSTGLGEVKTKAEVRYCRTVEEGVEYRLGFQIQGMDKDSAQIWVRFVRFVACGERSAA